ncbi:hypothetical protein ACFFRR_001744 [Megaselia abdita]
MPICFNFEKHFELRIRGRDEWQNEDVGANDDIRIYRYTDGPSAVCNGCWCLLGTFELKLINNAERLMHSLQQQINTIKSRFLTKCRKELNDACNRNNIRIVL